jgi:hypothetical protein
MRRLLVLLAIASLTAAIVTAQRQLTLLATVVSVDGSDLAALTEADFLIFEDDAEGKVLEIESAERPLKVQVLIDNGVGLSDSLVDLRNAIRNLINAVPEGVEVTLVTTSPQPRFLVRATTNRAELLAGVDRLAPESGAGSFAESLIEAAERISKEKPHTPVVISVATTAGESNLRPGDMQRARERLRDNLGTVHIVMYTGTRTSTLGFSQIELGQAIAEQTGGTYAAIAASNRLQTLLPEIMEQVKAKTGAGTATPTRQFHVKVERPGGRSGDLGRLRMGARAGIAVISSQVE